VAKQFHQQPRQRGRQDDLRRLVLVVENAELQIRVSRDLGGENLAQLVGRRLLIGGRQPCAEFLGGGWKGRVRVP
jgi:hypothetical protein